MRVVDERADRANTYWLLSSIPPLASWSCGARTDIDPEGGVSSEFAAANLDEALVFAHVGLADGVPVIRVQRVEPDGRLSATATIDISTMPTQGSLRLLGTPDQRSLIAAWEGPEGVSTMLKLDCTP